MELRKLYLLKTHPQMWQRIALVDVLQMILRLIQVELLDFFVIEYAIKGKIRQTLQERTGCIT